MSKTLSKKAKTALIVMLVVGLVAICCLFVSLYAKREMNKPTLEKAEEIPVYINENPESYGEKLSYAEKLYNDAFTDNAEVSYSTGVVTRTVKENEDADSNVIDYIVRGLSDKIKENYESYSSVRGDEAKKINDFTITEKSFNIANGAYLELTNGKTDDNGEIQNEDTAFIDFYCGSENTSVYGLDEIKNTFNIPSDEDVFEKTGETLSDMCDITVLDYLVCNYKINGEINRTTGQLKNLSFVKLYSFTLNVNFKGDYASFGSREITFEAEITDKYSFTWYGAYFTAGNLYMNPGDFRAVPASVTVNENAASGEDFVMKFVSSDESRVTVDEDGVVTAVEVTDKPVTITVTLEYLGKTYTDTIAVTVTELEVE